MDEELRRALRRVEPPAGFADRVLRSARSSQRAQFGSPKPAIVSKAFWRATAAATLALATIGGGVWYRGEEKRRAGEEASRQVLLSLNIAGSKLQAIAMKLNHEEER
jgi:hypothetical protein